MLSACKGQPCDPATVSTSLEVDLVSELTGSKVIASVERSTERRGQGQYVIRYQPTVKGRHQLHIKADGQHIRGSPFSVTVKLTSGETRHSNPNMGWFKTNLLGVAVSGKGEVVVTEYGAHRVSVFSPGGEKLRSFGTRGSGEGQFQHPCGVAVDGQGNILVTDLNNHRIQKFTSDGHFLKAVGSRG